MMKILTQTQSQYVPKSIIIADNDKSTFIHYFIINLKKEPTNWYYFK